MPISPNLVLLVCLTTGGALILSLGVLAARWLAARQPLLPIGGTVPLAEAAGIAARFAGAHNLIPAEAMVGDGGPEHWFAQNILEHVPMRGMNSAGNKRTRIESDAHEVLRLDADARNLWNEDGQTAAFTNLHIRRADLRRYLIAGKNSPEN